MPVHGDMEVKWSLSSESLTGSAPPPSGLQGQGDLEAKLSSWGFQETGYEKPMCKAG